MKRIFTILCALAIIMAGSATALAAENTGQSASYPMPEDEDLRTGQIEQITQYLQKEGKTAAHQLALAAAGMGAAFSDNDAVQDLASALMAELGKYNEPGQDDTRRQKPRLEKSQER